MLSTTQAIPHQVLDCQAPRVFLDVHGRVSLLLLVGGVDTLGYAAPTHLSMHQFGEALPDSIDAISVTPLWQAILCEIVTCNLFYT